MPRKGIVTTNPLYWMPVNVQEWLSKIAGSLTTEQFGGAVLLILTSWEQQPPCTLPSDPQFLAQRSGLGSRWTRSGPAVLTSTQFYEGRDGRLHADWLARLYREQRERYDHRSEAGKRNRAKREQVELELAATNGRTNGRTKRPTNGRTNTFQNEKGEGVSPTGITPSTKQAAPDAPAPPERAPAEERPVERGVRNADGAGLTAMRPATDILRLAGVPRR